MIAGYFRSINVFHTGVTMNKRTSTYVNRAVDKFRLDVVRASNNPRVLSDPTRPTRSAILENQRMRNLPLRIYTHTHTHTQYRLCSRHRRSYPPLHSPYALPFNAALLAGDLHFIPFLREITEIHIKYQAYVPKGGRNSSPSSTNLNIYRHFISFFRISRYIQYKFIFTYISFAFLAKITVTYTTFLFSISLRKQQIAEIPGIYVW